MTNISSPGINGNSGNIGINGRFTPDRPSSSASMYRYTRKLSDQYKNVKSTLNTQSLSRSRSETPSNLISNEKSRSLVLKSPKEFQKELQREWNITPSKDQQLVETPLGNKYSKNIKSPNRTPLLKSTQHANDEFPLMNLENDESKLETLQKLKAIEESVQSPKERKSIDNFVNDSIVSDLLLISKNLASAKKRQNRAKMLVEEKTKSDTISGNIEDNHQELSFVLDDIRNELSTPNRISTRRSNNSDGSYSSPNSTSKGTPNSHSKHQRTSSDKSCNTINKEQSSPNCKLNVSDYNDAIFQNQKGNVDSNIDRPVSEKLQKSQLLTPISVNYGISNLSPTNSQSSLSLSNPISPNTRESNDFSEIKSELLRISRKNTSSNSNSLTISPPMSPVTLHDEIEPAKIVGWWKALAKAIADAKPKDNSNMVRNLMKIAIKKKEKEVVKAQKLSERSLSALYKNKTNFTRRQTTAILRNINKDRFSDEVIVNIPVTKSTTYEKKSDPAVLLKNLLSRRRQSNTVPGQKSSERPRSTSRLHIKEFIPYTPEKKKFLSDTINQDYSKSIQYSDLSDSQEYPQEFTLKKQSILTKSSSRPKSAVAKSKYRSPSANPASIVLEFQKMAFQNDPVVVKTSSPKKKQRSRIDNGVVPNIKNEKKIGIGILPKASKV